MKKLCFWCRTWNRADVLKITVSRRAEEIIKYNLEKDVIIFIIDNQSTDNTPKVLKNLQKKYPFIIYWRSPVWKKQEEDFDIPEKILKKVKAEFTWFFGDDDILLKDTLPLVWKILNSEEAKESIIIHTGHALLKPHSYKIYKGTVWEFANLMGFNQFIGWITSVIFNTKLEEEKKNFYKKDFFEKIWPKYEKIYNKAAFSYVLKWLHLFTYEKAIVIDYPICEPLKHLDPKTGERWEKENIGWRYFLFIEGLKLMYQDGILQEKLKPGFFKYLTYNLWDRFLSEMIASRLGIYTRNPRPSEGWQYILDIADLIDDLTIAKHIKTNVYLARELCKEYQILKEKLESISKKKTQLNEKETQLKKDLNTRVDKIRNTLLETYKEIVRPIFKEGWAGKGYKDLKELNF